MLDEICLQGADGAPLAVRIAQALPNGPHTLELSPLKSGKGSVTALHVFQPPLAGD